MVPFPAAVSSNPHPDRTAAADAQSVEQVPCPPVDSVCLPDPSWPEDIRSNYTCSVEVASRLAQAGHEALLAGGCVRDIRLGRTPKDFDIATSATPEQVQALFTKTRAVGAHFGVILVCLRGHDIEVATFRKDGPYQDGRRPTHVTYSSAEEDAHRRDFTINGLFSTDAATPGPSQTPYEPHPVMVFPEMVPAPLCR